jgi:spore coat protein CotH
MKKILPFIVFSLQFCFSQTSVTLTDSNLPIVLIETDIDPSTSSQYIIPDEPKVPATMKIIYRTDGSRNYITDANTTAHLNYNGKIGIELRGSSSQSLPKKPYGLSTRLADNVTNNNVSLLGMPSENDWVLNALAFDPSMIRDYLSYNLARNMGNYAPRGRYVEVVVNGDYKGVYILIEKIKIDSNRVNVVKLTTTDNAAPNVTGGYIVKADKTTGGDVVAWTMPNYLGNNSNFLHDSPKTVDITTQQNTYIQSVFIDLAAITNPINTSITNGYTSKIDVPSFVDYMIMAELASNVDSYQLSTYFHKDRNSKLRAGPVWDYNLTFGNDLFQWGFDRSHTNVWQLDNGDNIGAKFWKDLFDEPTFKCYLSKRWNQLTASGGVLNYTTISNLIDQYVALLSESQVRENTRWATVGTQTANIAAMKTWIQDRITWLTTNFGSFTACNTVTLPNLVISRIHYNPLTVGTNTSNNLEFIEITNNSSSTVDLTGFYIRELGISYLFPANSTINANQKIYICSNTSTFTSFYGFAPFGQFTRNLSNSSYKIVLADAYGNTIDEVQYQDVSPWPTAADGTGPYLQLVNINSDNSLGTNWIASTSVLSLENNAWLDQTTNVYPNPSISKINISNTNEKIKAVTIFDIQGRKIINRNEINTNELEIDMTTIANGLYTAKIEFDNNQFVSKRISKK